MIRFPEGNYLIWMLSFLKGLLHGQRSDPAPCDQAKKTNRSPPFPLPVPAPHAVAGSESLVDVLLKNIECRNPDILYLYGVGNGAIWTDGMFDDDKIDLETETTNEGKNRLFPIFRHETLIAHDWDIKGIFYNLTQTRFPDLKTIVLLSHPCDYSVPWRCMNWNWILPRGHNKYFDDHPQCYVLKRSEQTRLLSALPYIASYTTVGPDPKLAKLSSAVPDL